MAIVGYVVELEPGVYLCDEVQGDPGRTLKVGSASVYKSNAKAQTALAKAQRFRAFAGAYLFPVRTAPREVEAKLNNVQEIVDRPDYTNPEGMVRELRVALAGGECRLCGALNEGPYCSELCRSRDTDKE